MVYSLLRNVKNHVRMTSMKTLPKVEISDDLDAQINEGMKVSELCKADVIRPQVITLEHTAQDLPSRLASILSNPRPAT